MSTDIEQLRTKLGQYGQDHVLAYVHELTESERLALVDQIESIDFDSLEGLIGKYVHNIPPHNIPSGFEPPPIIPPGGGERRSEALRRGEELLRGGKVCAFVVAGGQGTRLGYDGPKGCFPATPVRKKPLFQVFAEQIRAAAARCGTAIAWYILTSPVNDSATRKHFERNEYWGMDPDDVVFVIQGTMPAIDYRGKLMLSDRAHIAVSPDGHGGSLTALRRSGALGDMKRRGVAYISYFQVDNPMVRCLDPVFIGLHDLDGAGMSAKALEKTDPLEKVGNLCMAGGRVHVIEYSDMPDDLATARNEDGSLRFSAGSIGVHVFSREFIERLTDGSCPLPLHRADKKVAHLDESGQLVRPQEPNAVKLEMFVFDALPLSENSVILRTERGEEFSPIKNREGPASPETCTRDQCARSASWLKDAGVEVPADAVVEISPLFADSRERLIEKVDKSMRVEPGQRLYLE